MDKLYKFDDKARFTRKELAATLKEYLGTSDVVRLAKEIIKEYGGGVLQKAIKDL